MSKGATRKTIKALKKAHPKLRALLKATGYDYKKAADYSGLSYTYVSKLARGEANYPAGTHAITALGNGLARLKSGDKAPGASTRKPYKRNGGDHDKGELGLAFVLTDQKQLETIYDVGEKAGGTWVYRRKIGDRWLIVLKLEDKEKLATFRAIGRLAYDVVTP